MPDTMLDNEDTVLNKTKVDLPPRAYCLVRETQRNLVGNSTNI